MRFDPDTAAGRSELLRAMVVARSFDQAMCRHNKHWHEARGEEATYIGAFSALQPGDVAAPHFRGACGVALMHGAAARELAAGVFGTEGSTSAGHWRGDICPTPGSTSIGMFSGSLGTTVSYAVGAALHLDQAASGGAALVAFGDGTANAGIVAESMNMAAMLALPIVLICQDNQYATSLPSRVAIAGSVADRARALGMPTEEVDGNDVLEVAGRVHAALDRARGGAGPTFLHALTYRMGGHYMNDPETYRTPDEVAAWGEKDPILRLTRTLVDTGQVTAGEVDDLAAAQDQVMEQDVAAARGGAAIEAAALPPAAAYAESWRSA